jgi:hypothetical protein
VKERLLQFIWQFQHFNRNGLTTVTGEEVQVQQVGRYNTNQGPDFLDARIRVGNTDWAGSVELHTLTSDWYKHGHQADRNYDNVILHVVWEHDVGKREGPLIPILELNDKVPKWLLQRYEEWMHTASFIPCERSINTFPALNWKSWKDRLVIERLERRANWVDSYCRQNNYHWEETGWWLIARNFGMPVNADAFESIARSIPVRLLAKRKQQLIQLEALLFGQAWLLNKKFREKYPRLLQKEYRFLQKSFGLEPVTVPVHFLRMRPANFPTVRLAQLAALVNKSSQLFSKIREEDRLTEIRSLFDVTANDYWHYHYRFDEDTAFREKKLGKSMIDSIIINAVCPLLFAYGTYHKLQQYKDRALDWLEKTPAELNSITRAFRGLGISGKTAFDSQALLELKTHYCDQRKCLECGVGNFLLAKN